jgi:hypothetical protein
VIEPLYSCVALFAKDAFSTLVPADSRDQSLTVLSGIIEIFWGTTEVSGVMCEITAFRVMRVFIFAPGGLIEEHVEGEKVGFLGYRQILVKAGTVRQTLRHVVVFNPV